MPIRKKKASQGKVRNATSIVIDGITFKSKLEVYCYKRLKEENIYNEYEKYAFILQPDFISNSPCFEVNKRNKQFEVVSAKIRPITYKPDFVNVKDNWIIECKGYPNDVFPMKWKMFKWYLKQNNINTRLFLPRNMKQVDEVIKLIKNEDR